MNKDKDAKFYLIFSFISIQPYLGLAVFPSDIQPFAVLLGIYIIIISKNSYCKNYTLHIFPFIFLFILSVFSLFLILFRIQLGRYTIYESEGVLIGLTRVMWAYLTPLVILMATLKIPRDQFVIIVPRLFILLSFTTVLGYVINLFGLTYFIQLFVNRAIYDAGGVVLDPSRGLTSFFPEQSRVAEQFSFILILLSFVRSINWRKLLLIFIICLPSLSGQFFLSFFIAILSFFLAFIFSRIVNKKFFIPLIALMIFSSAFIWYQQAIDLVIELMTYFSEMLSIQSRGIEAVITILTLGVYGFSSDHGVIVKLSGITGAISSLISNPFNFHVGFSLSPSLIESIGPMQLTVENFFFGNDTLIGFDRPYGALGTYLIDLGILGLVLVIFISFNHLRLILINGKSPQVLFGLIFLFFYFWIKVPISNPSLWFLLGAIILLSRPSLHKSVKVANENGNLR